MVWGFSPDSPSCKGRAMKLGRDWVSPELVRVDACGRAATLSEKELTDATFALR